MGNNLEIEVLSKQKGSNPGGMCNFIDGKREFKGYFKYVNNGTMGMRTSSLEAKNQPIYEAITFELANKLGLETSRYYVLLNEERDLKFSGDSAKSHFGRQSYFISKFKKGDRPDKMGEDIVEGDMIYLESLKISDVIGKRQNYLLLNDFSPNGLKPVYIDLGCSFVRAVGGKIHVPNGLNKVRMTKFNKKKLRELKNHSIILKDNESLVNFGELIETFPKMTLPTLNPFGRRPIDELLNKLEIKEIQKYLLSTFHDNLQSFRDEGLLV